MIELMIAAIPSSITALCFWWLQRRITEREENEKEERKKRQKEMDDREARREEFEFNMLQLANASAALSEATARAVQRIPEAHCNGDMHAALEYADRVKKKQREFMFKQGIKNLI